MLSGLMFKKEVEEEEKTYLHMRSRSIDMSTFITFWIQFPTTKIKGFEREIKCTIALFGLSEKCEI